jgi:hypothetical protein
MKRSLVFLPLCLVLVAFPGVAQYCTSTSNFTACANAEEFISNVTIGTLNHNSACLNAPAYEDYTSLVGPTLAQLSGTPISVTVSNWYSTTDSVTVFVDWNGNTVLNDAGEVFPLVQGPSAPGGAVAYTGTITPPAGAVATTRMRVKTVWGVSSNPCGASSWSNTEDYTVNTLPPSGLVASGNAAPNPVVASSPVLFTVAMSATSPPNPPTGLLVQMNLSQIGGSATQVLYDDGFNGGDVTAGDLTFSWTQAPTLNGTFFLPYNAIDGIGRTANGTVTLNVNPANDTCATATTVILGTNGPFSNAFATDSGVVGSCATGYKDVWYVFNPPCTGPYRIDTCSPALFDTVLTAYSACGSGELACNDDGTGCGLTSTIDNLGLTAGVPIWIRVASYASTGTGNFNLNINQVYAVAWSSPFGPGSVQFNLSGGPQNGTFFHAITLAPGAYPNGWFYGIDLTFPEIINEISLGFPFVGGLDGCGGAQFGPISGVPAGLTVYSVAVASPGAALSLPTHHSAAVTYVIP